MNAFLGKIGSVPKQGKKEKRPKAKIGVGVSSYGKREAVLWSIFSIFIRLRDCGDNSHGYSKCISCSDTGYFRDMDAGHFIVRGFKPTKYDERNVHAQCFSCNREKEGNVKEYSKALGIKLSEALKDKSRMTAKKMLLCEVEEMITEYKGKAKIEARRVGVEIR